MGIVLDFLEEIGKFILWLVFDVVMVVTGEVVLWTLTAGRRKPRWDLYMSERPAKFVVFSELSCWVGIATWLIAAAAIHRLVPGAGGAA
jgi:hypothetical protein